MAQGSYQPKEIVGTYTDRYGETVTLHRPKGRALRALKNMDTPALRMNRISAKLIGQLINQKRIERGLSLEQLAVMAGLASQTPKAYMWSIENAKRDHGVRIGTLFALCRVLECEISDITPSVAHVAVQAGVTDVTVVRAA